MARILNIHFDLVRALARSIEGRAATAEALLRRQSRRLRELVEYAARFSPYYRGWFDGLGLDPADIRMAGDLAHLPVLEKCALQERLADIVSTEVNFHTCPQRHTSGTSGIPFALPAVPLENLLDVCLWGRCYMAGGHRPWRRQAKIILPSRIPARRSLIQRLGFFRRDYLDSTLPPEAKIQALRDARPDTLVCWASMMDEITTYLEQTDSHLDIPQVFSSASMLWPHVRRRAEQRLKTRVTDLYGAVETSLIAWECEQHRGYHVLSDQVVVELLDENDRPARQGRIVCTVLWRRACPLIRYAIGDTAEWAEAPCPCGRPYPLLKSLTGRDRELVLLPGGTQISSVTIRNAVIDKPGVEQYQFVQESPARFRLRIVPGPTFTVEVERSILDQFHRQFGGALSLRITKVRRICMPPGVKFTPIASLEYLDRLKTQGRDIGAFAEDAG